MTEIQQVPPQNPPTPTPAVGGGFPSPSSAVATALQEWVGGMAASVEGAEFIVDTPMCPDAFWPLPAAVKVSKIPGRNPKLVLPGEDQATWAQRRTIARNTLAAVVRYGLQLGIPPEVAAQGIFIIGGRMAMYAEQMVALIKMRGHGHRIAVRDGVLQRSRGRVTVEVCRKGTDVWIPTTFTITDAIDMGYVPGMGPNADLGKWPDGTPKTGGNEKYLTDPAAMLYARASSIACRTEFPDVLRGLMTVEEMLDEQRARQEVEVTVEASTPRPRASAAALLARTALSEAEDEAVRGEPETQPAERQGPPTEAVTVADPEPQPEPRAGQESGPVVERAVLPISPGQTRDLMDQFRGLGIGGRSAGGRESRLAVARHVVGRDVKSAAELTSDEAEQLVSRLRVDGWAVLESVLGVQPDPGGHDVPVEDPPGDPEGWQQ